MSPAHRTSIEGGKSSTLGVCLRPAPGGAGGAGGGAGEAPGWTWVDVGGLWWKLLPSQVDVHVDGSEFPGFVQYSRELVCRWYYVGPVMHDGPSTVRKASRQAAKLFLAPSLSSNRLALPTLSGRTRADSSFFHLPTVNCSHGSASMDSSAYHPHVTFQGSI